MILVIDFDQRENRLAYVDEQFPSDLTERVFSLGVLSNPEQLKREVGKSFDQIGETRANDCSDQTTELWGHNLLSHNQRELDRIISSVRPFLFDFD